MLDIDLVHGWIVDPQSNPELYSLTSELSYNQCVDKILLKSQLEHQLEKKIMERSVLEVKEQKVESTEDTKEDINESNESKISKISTDESELKEGPPPSILSKLSSFRVTKRPSEIDMSNINADLAIHQGSLCRYL